MSYLYYSLIGFLGSVVGSYCGVGGGVIFVPLFLLITNYNNSIASIFSVGAVIFLSITSIIKYIKNNRKINWRISIPTSITAILGGILSTLYIQPLMDKEIMIISYISLSIFILILMILKNKIKLRIPQNLFILFFIGLIFGSLSGIFGIGGGVLYVPALVILFGYKTKNAGPTALVITGITAISVMVTHLLKGSLVSADVPILFLVGVVAIFGAFLGTFLNGKSKPKTVYFIFIILIIFIITSQLLSLFNIL